jgi:hypothetical protein
LQCIYTRELVRYTHFLKMVDKGDELCRLYKVKYSGANKSRHMQYAAAAGAAAAH